MNHRRMFLFISSLMILFSCSQGALPQGERAQEPPERQSGVISSSATEAARGVAHVDGDSSRLSLPNEPPSVIRASLRLENENNLDTLKVLPVVADQDGDAVTLAYEWTKNGESAGNGEVLSGFRRGDAISVKIIPYDGKEYGQSKNLSMEIRNTCPRALGHSDFLFDGTVLTTRVKATDPDGDSVTYSLLTPPAGMSIEEETGLLRWTVPADFVGRQEVKVRISDGVGGELLYTLPIEVAKVAEKTVR